MVSHEVIPLMRVDPMHQWRLSCLVCTRRVYRLRTGGWRHHVREWGMRRYPPQTTALARGGDAARAPG